MKTEKRLASNTAYLLTDWFLATFLSFLFWLMLGKTLHPNEYGIVATSINLVILISSVALLGLNISLIKLVPEALKKEGTRGVHSLVRLSMKPLFISLISLSTILLIFSSQLSPLLKMPRDVFLLNVFAIVAFTLYLFFGQVLYSLQNMRRYVVTNTAQFAMRLILVALILFFGFRYFGVLIGFSLSFLFIMFLRMSPNYFRKNETSMSYKRIFEYAFPALITTIALNLIMYSQYVILTVLRDTSITGIFAIAFMTTSLIGIVPSVLNSALMPIISELSIDKKTKVEQSRLISLVLRYSFFFSFPISILLLAFSKYAVLLVSKAEYLSSASYFPILVPAAMLYGLGGVFMNNIYITGNPKRSRNIITATAALFLLTSIVLTKYFSAIGLSSSYLMSMIFFFLVSFTYLKKSLIIKFPWNDVGKITIGSLTIFSILYLVRPFVQSFFLAIPLGIASLAIYLLALFYLRFYRIEDVKALEFFIQKVPLGKRLMPIANFLRGRMNE